MHDPHEHFNQALTRAHENALMADQYRADRDRVHIVPYQPMPAQIEPCRSTSDELTMKIIQAGKPLIALSVVGGTIAIIGATVVGVIGSGLAFIGANATAIGGGVVAVVIGVLALFGARGAAESSDTGSNASTPQNIHVTVNVAGQSVTTNSK